MWLRGPNEEVYMRRLTRSAGASCRRGNPAAALSASASASAILRAILLGLRPLEDVFDLGL